MDPLFCCFAAFASFRERTGLPVILARSSLVYESNEL